ncbi:hypothetical protein J6590_053195, partial [Homalodisca vitripennis]
MPQEVGGGVFALIATPLCRRAHGHWSGKRHPLRLTTFILHRLPLAPVGAARRCRELPRMLRYMGRPHISFE